MTRYAQVSECASQSCSKCLSLVSQVQGNPTIFVSKFKLSLKSFTALLRLMAGAVFLRSFQQNAEVDVRNSKD